MFTLNWTNVRSALIYGLLSAFVAVGVYAIGIGDIFELNWQDLINAGVFGFLISIVSVVKNLLTADNGKFVGLVKVVEPK